MVESASPGADGEETAETASPDGESGYVPGTCNIGRTERRRRYAVGAVGFLVAAAVVVAVALLSLPPAALLSAVLPLFVGFLGYLQGQRAFCVGFARLGVYDVSDRGDDRHEVTDAAARERDRAAGRRLYRDAALAATAVSILLFVAGEIVGY